MHYFILLNIIKLKDFLNRNKSMFVWPYDHLYILSLSELFSQFERE